jgi:hypothetical protein
MIREPKKRERFGSWKPPAWRRIQDFLIEVSKEENQSLFINDNYDFMKERLILSLDLTESECGQAFGYLKKIGLISGPNKFTPKLGELVTSPNIPCDSWATTSNRWDGNEWVKPMTLLRRTRVGNYEKKVFKKLDEKTSKAFKDWDNLVYRLNVNSDIYKKLTLKPEEKEFECFKCNRKFKTLKDHDNNQCKLYRVMDVMGI